MAKSKNGSSKKSRPTKTTRGSGSTLDVSKQKSMRIRQIENGFVVTEEGTTGSGNRTKYFSREYFSPTEPKINIPTRAGAAVKFGGKK